jgi:organic radical activating enzyme
VIAATEDVSEVLDLIAKHDLPRERIFLMPEGTDSATLRERERWLAPLALQHGLRLSDRMHIHLYGDTRGT